MDVAFSYDNYDNPATGIIVVQENAQDNHPEAIFAPDGKRLKAMQRGLNIIRTKDGKVIKILK